MSSDTDALQFRAGEVVEQFAALDALKICRAAFVKRIPGIEVTNDKAEVLRRLEIAHSAARRGGGMELWRVVSAEQVHGNRVAVIDSTITEDKEFAGYDGFVTNQRGIALGVYVADCCAVYMVDPKTPAVGLVHSGKKGTELAIAPRAIALMKERFGSDPGNM